MGDVWPLVVLVPLGYLLGSIPFGLLVGLARGVDVRTAGSGNIGASNVGRLLGGRFFALVCCLDVLKGLLPVLAGSFVVGRDPAWWVFLLWLLSGFAAVLGHMFSLFLGFHGGKGVATGAGLMLGLFPYYTYPAVAAIGVFVLLVLATRYISVASIGAAVSFPMAYAAIGVWQRWELLGRQWPLLVFAVVIAVLIVWKHRGNIARLRAGTEFRVGHARPKPSATT